MGKKYYQKKEGKIMKDSLERGEIHPSARPAFEYILKTMSSPQFEVVQESLASCALSGNRLAEVCLGTIDRIIKKEPLSDRYLLGLAWFLKEMEDEKKEHVKQKKYIYVCSDCGKWKPKDIKGTAGTILGHCCDICKRDTDTRLEES